MEKPAQSPSLDRRAFLHSAACAAAGVLVAPSLRAASSPGGEANAANWTKYKTGQRIAATPTYRYRPYRSRSARSAETVSWVQIDLGQERPIETILLYPANQRMVPGTDQYFAGEAFPVRFKIEAASSAEFGDSMVLADLTADDFENPGDEILGFPAKGAKARFVRLTVRKMAKPECSPKENTDAPEGMAFCDADGPYRFALAKIGVESGGADVAVSRPVTADSTYGNEKDLAQLTRAERVETEYVRPGDVATGAECSRAAARGSDAPWRAIRGRDAEQHSLFDGLVHGG